jgi:hypothetical protein
MRYHSTVEPKPESGQFFGEALMSKRILIMLLCAMTVGCSEKKPLLSEEEARHKAEIDSCFSLLVEAGAKWYQGDQVGNICDRRYPTRPEQARLEILGLLKTKRLVPPDASYPILLPEGNCKSLAQRYVDLNEQAYHMNSGTAKNSVLLEASNLRAAVEMGVCTLPRTASVIP